MHILNYYKKSRKNIHNLAKNSFKFLFERQILQDSNKATCLLQPFKAHIENQETSCDRQLQPEAGAERPFILERFSLSYLNLMSFRLLPWRYNNLRSPNCHPRMGSFYYDVASRGALRPAVRLN